MGTRGDKVIDTPKTWSLDSIAAQTALTQTGKRTIRTPANLIPHPGRSLTPLSIGSRGVAQKRMSASTDNVKKLFATSRKCNTTRPRTHHDGSSWLRNSARHGYPRGTA